MKVIIPAAGVGERMMPHTTNEQKALLPVAGKSIIDYTLEAFRGLDITEVVIIIGYLSDNVRRHMEKYTTFKTTFVEQREQLGLGHAISLGLTPDHSPVGIVLADTIYSISYDKFFDGKSNKIAVIEVEDPTRFGIVEVNGNQITDMVEKPEVPKSNLAIAGVYQLESQYDLMAELSTLMDNKIQTNNEYQLTDALKRILLNGNIFEAVNIEGWYDCGTIESILKTNQKILSELGSNYTHPSSRIINSTISNTSTMEDCLVKNSNIENCIIFKGSTLEDCSIKNQIIRAGSNLIRNAQVSR